MELAFHLRLKTRCSTHSLRPNRPGEGTGLGLSISHDIIVKQHGGSIEVDTELGKFTEMSIILPRLTQSGHRVGFRPPLPRR